MKSIAVSLLALVGAVSAADPFSKAEYKSGAVMQQLMGKKESLWSSELDSGRLNASHYPSLHSDIAYVKCVDGYAVVESDDPSQTFRCSGIDMYDFRNHVDLGSCVGEGSSSWGWVSEDGREFAAIGQADGTAFAEISQEGKLVYLGRLPTQSHNSFWREIRGFKHYMIIGSEAEGHYVQIFDMKKLLEIDPQTPKTFDNATELTALAYENIPTGAAHNVVVNEERNYIAAVGANPRDDKCASGLIFYDLTDPEHPTSPGCASADGYIHDAECVIYHGPDQRYEGHDICYAYAEDTVTIFDVSSKEGFNAGTVISRTHYDGATYVHQGAVTNLTWQQYLLVDDELDEVKANGTAAAQGYPVTYIMDISDLENPVVTGYYRSADKAVDHNQYVFGDRVYQSNYAAGLRVYDISSIPRDPSGDSVTELGFFDVHPEDDADGGSLEFLGTWSHYAGYPSGFVLVNTIERGAFVVRLQEDTAHHHDLHHDDGSEEHDHVQEDYVPAGQSQTSEDGTAANKNKEEEGEKQNQKAGACQWVCSSNPYGIMCMECMQSS